MRSVEYTVAATRQLRKLPADVRKRIIEKIKRYAETGAGSSTKLVGEPGTRLRIGDYRAILTEEPTTVQVLAVGHRREIYR